jgi:hypothetical protein
MKERALKKISVRIFMVRLLGDDIQTHYPPAWIPQERALL